MTSIDEECDQLLNDGLDDYLLAINLQQIEYEYNSEENKANKNTVEFDYEFAKQLAEEFANELVEDIDPSDKSSIVSPELELTDPNPNIWQLMKQFDHRFFGNVLSKHCIELSWSPRMTRTAGLCGWSPSTNYCFIRLSLPLHQLRSRKDLVETLIHEMIHALLFVTHEDDNHESHGQRFHEHMYRINRESGTNITVYHDFHDEVKHYLTHIWRCDGKCRDKSPYYGYVKRAMNRKPGPYDYWFKFHEQTCGGTFVKVSEPTKEVKTNKRLKQNPSPEKAVNRDIRQYFDSPHKPSTSSAPKNAKTIPFQGLGVKLGSSESKSLPKSSSPQKSNDIRNFLSPKKVSIKSNDKLPQIQTHSGSDPKQSFDKLSDMLMSKKDSGIVNFDKNRDNYKPKPTITESDPSVQTFENNKNRENTTNRKLIDSYLMPKISANIRTFSSLNSSEDELKEKQIKSSFSPFTGRGNVLGSIKSVNNFRMKCNNNSVEDEINLDLDISVIKTIRKPDIEVIQID